MPHKRIALAAVLALGACTDYPRDTEGTLDRVKAGEIRIGWSQDARGDAALTALALAIARSNDSRVKVQRGTIEPLLLRLEAGELDVVLGHFDQKSPWMKRVTFSRPVATHEVAGGMVDSLAATRNGEHAFSMAVDRAVIAQGEAAQ